MNTGEMRLKVLGARGSLPVSGREFEIFGGATSCYQLQAGGETVFLDAGSGLCLARQEGDKAPVILLTHLHLDHILGLGMYPRFSGQGEPVRLYVPAADAREAEEKLAGLYSPPFWPLPLTEYAGAPQILPLALTLRIGPVQVTGMEGPHPGGCRILRLEYGGKKLVYATDIEVTEEIPPELAAFCEGADLILFDAQYSAEEAPGKRGYGHSTAEAGLALFEASGARKMRLIHHDPRATDAVLSAREEKLGCAAVRYARAGEEVLL